LAAPRARIIYWILLPVLAVGILIAAGALRYSLPPLVALYTGRVDAALQLASRLGLARCEDSFNYLLDLRLEDDLEMNAALRRETVAEIGNLSRDIEGVHLLVVQGDGSVVGTSSEVVEHGAELPDFQSLPDGVSVQRLGGENVRLHWRYFPFWDWTIVSFATEESFLRPIGRVRASLVAGLAGGVLLLVGTLFLVFRLFVDRPLESMIRAADGVARGGYGRIERPGRDEIGRLARAFNAMVDGLEKRDGEVRSLLEAVRTSEGRFRTLFESAPMGIGLVDGAGVLVQANPALLTLLGVRGGAQQNISLGPLFTSATEGSGTPWWSGGTTDAGNRQGVMQRLDGSRFDARLTACSLPLGDDELTLLLAEDVTAEKQLSASMQRARKMEALGTLAGGVAHDLNNILSAIVGYPELLLLDLEESSPLVRPIRTIQRSGEKAAAIVQDLLTLARRGVAVSEVTCLNDIVRDYLVAPEFEKLKQYHSQVQIVTDLAPDLLHVRGSPIHLAKTLMNLVSNAAEAMPAGGTVWIRTANRCVDRPVDGYDHVREGEYAVLSVRDSGEGIAPDDLERIFEPFYTKKVMGRSGTGLGMAVVWGTVKDHDGYINVDSTPGKGSTFTLFFPVTREAGKPDAAALSAEHYRGQGERILVVDDVPEQRELAEAMLGGLGYAVTTAVSGEAAVESVRQHPVDLVVLDMIMDPGIDGLETFRRLRELDSDLRAIIASGFSETERVREAQGLGAGTYVRKPYTRAKLAEAVHSELRRG